MPIIRIFLLFISINISTVHSQSNDSLLNRVSEQLNYYTILHNSPGLYLHIDKSIYVPNEHIWFTSYFVNPVTDPASYHTLYILLVEPLTKKIVANDRFVISDGIGKGQLLLQDSMAAGEYRLVAYTNAHLDNINVPVYQQSISLRSAYKAEWLMTTQADISVDSPSLITRVMSSNYVFAKGGKFNYTLYGDNKPLYTGTKIIDRFGEVHIPYSVKDGALKLELAAKVFYNNDTILLRQPVEIARLHINMKLYPESGNLVAGHLSKVAFEIFTNQGKAVATTGTIFENNKPVAKFSSNQYGQGTFNIKPEAGNQYTIALDETNPHVLHTTFPSVELSGYTISVKTAVINDILKVIIQAPSANSNCILLLHNYNEQFYSARISIKETRGLLTLPVNKLPPGVATITLLNDQGIAVAERAILIKNDKQIKVSMTVDSAIYHKRGKVQLKVKLADENDRPIHSSFSLACVLANRLDTGRFIDIDRYEIFDQYLPEAGTLPALSYLNNELNAELILLTRFWTRYNWDKINSSNYPTHKLKGIYGHVLYRNKPVRQRVELALFGNSLEVIITDSSGRFQLPANQLNGPADSKIFLSVNVSKNLRDYKIVLESDIDSFNILLAGKEYNSMIIEKDELSADEKKGSKNVLRTVVISKKIAFDEIYHSRNCDDYVCMYNILNCSNHPGEVTKPVNGNTYLFRTAGRMLRVLYAGCNQRDEINPYIKKLKATYFQKEFYVADYLKYNPLEEDTHTTIYWSHQIVTDKNGEAIISFYTNDLAGRFICVLEGLTEKGVVSSKIKFGVSN